MSPRPRHRRASLSEAEDRIFVTLWEAGHPAGDIARALGLTSKSSVGSVRLRLGLPARRCRAITREAAAPGEAPGDGAKAGLSVPKMPPHPFWDALKDLAVMQTGGRHRAVDALAAELGKPRVAVVQRFHQLRAG